MASFTTLGKYEILGRLGSGGMAEVFLARQVGAAGFEKRVAIKRLAAHRVSDPVVVRSLINEARLVGQLTHPNLVQVFDFEQLGEEYCLVMEYVEGMTLDELLNRCSQAQVWLPRGLLIYLAQEVLTGLDYAHTATAHDGTPLMLVHRDLKPSNIMISKRGLVKVMDFGIAKAVTNVYQTTASGGAKGTLAYMSPEQLSGSPVTATSDLFSFGVMLYELATLEPLFEDTNLVKLAHDLFQGLQPRAEARLAARFPELVPILKTLLNPEPAARYPDARALLQALRPLALHSSAHEMMMFLEDIESVPQDSAPSNATVASDGAMSQEIARQAQTLVSGESELAAQEDFRATGNATEAGATGQGAFVRPPTVQERALAVTSLPPPTRLPPSAPESQAFFSGAVQEVSEMPPVPRAAPWRWVGAGVGAVVVLMGAVLWMGGSSPSPLAGPAVRTNEVAAAPTRGETLAEPSLPAAVPPQSTSATSAPAGSGPAVSGPVAGAPAAESRPNPDPISKSPASAPAAKVATPTSQAGRPASGASQTGVREQSSTKADRSSEAKTGFLIISAQPWAEVFVDGKSHGEFLKDAVATGKHQVRLVGPEGQEKRFEVEVEPGAKLTRIWSFVEGQWVQ